MCFECPNGEYFDIEHWKCVPNCEGIVYEGAEYHNKKFCWPFSYNKTIEIFVHPSNNKPKDMGTWEHPYKSIQHAIVDINMNINNWTDVDLILWIAERSRIELQSYSFFVENLNSLTISSYSIDARVENKDSQFSILSATDKPWIVSSQRILFYLHTFPELAI